MTTRKRPTAKPSEQAAAALEAVGLANGTPAGDPPADGADPAAVFLIHPAKGHVVHVTAAAALELDPAGTWATATPAQIAAAGLAG